MSNKEILEILSKYSDAITWKDGMIASQNPTLVIAWSMTLKDIKNHVIKTTGCTEEKYDSIFNQLVLYVEPEDVPIVESHFDYIDSIRKAHQ